MTYPTREQIEEYIRNNKLDVDESYPRSDWWKFKQQRDKYKQQRDELRKDVTKLHEHNSELEHENKALRLQADTYFEQWQDTKSKAQAFDEISKLRDNIKFIKDVSLSHATKEPVNQEMYWVHSLMDSLLEGLEVKHE